MSVLRCSQRPSGAPSAFLFTLLAGPPHRHQTECPDRPLTHCLHIPFRRRWIYKLSLLPRLLPESLLGSTQGTPSRKELVQYYLLAILEEIYMF